MQQQEAVQQMAQNANEREEACLDIEELTHKRVEQLNYKGEIFETFKRETETELFKWRADLEQREYEYAVCVWRPPV